MRLKTPSPPPSPESVTEILHQIGRAVSEAGKALERLADAAARLLPPPQPPAPERPPEPPPRSRAGYINTEYGSGYISAQVVAKRFGIKTGTLSKWRSSGRGRTRRDQYGESDSSEGPSTRVHRCDAATSAKDRVSRRPLELCR